MIKGILQLVIRFLLCFLAQLNSLLEFQATLDLSMAEGNPALQATLECARDNAQVSMDNLLKSLGPLEPILGTVTSVGGIVGLPLELPDFSEITAEAGADKAIASVHEAVESMQQVIDSLPI